MKRWSIVLITILFLALAGCGGSSGGGVLPPDDGSGGEDTPSAEDINEVQAEDVLYAAYAGIGYNKAGLGEEDDEALYNVMFDDLNEMVGELVLELISHQTPYDLTMALGFISGETAHLVYTTDQVRIDLTLDPESEWVNPNGSFTLHALLTADFNTTGYEYRNGNAVYYGNVGNTDFEANMEIDVVAKQVDGAQTSQITIPSFVIDAHSSLGVSYAETATHQAFNVQYQGWSVSYSVEENGVNIHIIPVSTILGALGPLGIDPDDLGMGEESYPDHRLYTLSGSFDIDNAPYLFDMKYVQFDGKAISGESTMQFIALGGKVGVPSLGGEAVDVSSPLVEILNGNFAIDPVPDAIIRNNDPNDDINDGLWTSGKMTIAAEDNEVNVDFNEDGSADFKDSFGEEWSEPEQGETGYWQDTLDPLL